MKYLFLQYPKCSKCKKAQNWLNWNKIIYESRDISEKNPSEEELAGWIEKSGLSVESFFNANGVLYKEMGLKDKISSLSEEEKIKLLSTNGMLVKRPIIVGEDKVLVGFKESEWKQAIKNTGI